jgi:hypothetical protein
MYLINAESPQRKNVPVRTKNFGKVTSLNSFDYTQLGKNDSRKKKSKPKTHIVDAYQLPNYRIQNM